MSSMEEVTTDLVMRPTMVSSFPRKPPGGSTANVGRLHSSERGSAACPGRPSLAYALRAPDADGAVGWHLRCCSGRKRELSDVV